MKNILYNTKLNTFSKIYENGYDVPIPEDYVKKLVVVDVDKPTLEANQWATSKYVVDGDEYKQVWTVHTKTAYEIACEGWPHMDFALRIVVPKSLIQQYREILIFKSYFEVMGLPIEILPNEIHLYCNEILANDQPVITQMCLTINNRPKLEDYD